MEDKYFTNPQLSDKLEKLGVESQFDYIWGYRLKQNVPDEFIKTGGINYGVLELQQCLMQKKESNGMYPKRGKIQQAYHFSDILLPKNYTKIFNSNEIYNGILEFIFPWEDDNWQQWLEKEVDKALNK